MPPAPFSHRGRSGAVGPHRHRRAAENRVQGARRPGEPAAQALGWHVATLQVQGSLNDSNHGDRPLRARLGLFFEVESPALSLTLLPLLAIGVLGYFFFIRPQQRKAQAARAQQNSGIDVGDEVQTVGGVIGTVLESTATATRS